MIAEENRVLSLTVTGVPLDRRRNQANAFLVLYAHRSMKIKANKDQHVV